MKLISARNLCNYQLHCRKCQKSLLQQDNTAPSCNCVYSELEKPKELADPTLTRPSPFGWSLRMRLISRSSLHVQEVEPMYHESDHIHISALTAAVGVNIRVQYMDRGEGGRVNHHDFPEGTEPRIHILYRPGHYDILYP